MTAKKTVRVGCHSAFWGDTETAAVQLVRHGDVDYLVSDYLAEVTMSIMAAQKLRNQQAGYATDFVTVVMGPLAREIADRKIKVITNAGGVNPLACREAVLKACEAAGVTLKVAVVLGDDLLLRADELRGLGIVEMDTGAELPAKITSIIPIPICPSIERFTGTRYAALNPSIKLLMTLDAAHKERANASTRSPMGRWPRIRNCCITIVSVPGGKICARNAARFCCT